MCCTSFVTWRDVTTFAEYSPLKWSVHVANGGTYEFRTCAHAQVITIWLSPVPRLIHRWIRERICICMADMRMHMRGFYGLRLVAGPNWLSPRLGRFTAEFAHNINIMHIHGWYAHARVGLTEYVVAGPNWLFTGECSERSGFWWECGARLGGGGTRSHTYMY